MVCFMLKLKSVHSHTQIGFLFCFFQKNGLYDVKMKKTLMDSSQFYG